MKEIAPEVGQVVKIKDEFMSTLERRGCGSTPDKCGVSASLNFLQISPSPVQCYLENFVGEMSTFVVTEFDNNSGELNIEKGCGNIYCASEKTVIKNVFPPEVNPTS